MSLLDRTIQGIPYRDFLKEEAQRIAKDDVMGLSAELAYRSFLALLPLTMFLGAASAVVAGMFGIQNPGELLIDTLAGQMPQEVAAMMEQQLAEALEEPRPFVMAGTLFASIMLGAGAMNTLIKSLNRVYSVKEERLFWKRYLVAVTMVMVAGVLLVLAIAVFVAGGFYGAEIAQGLGLPEALGGVLAVLRWPLTFFVLAVMVGYIYWVAPATHFPFRWASLGAGAFAVGWLVSTWLFLLYVRNFADYANTYGILAGIAILLIWLYVTSMVLFAGAEANAILDRRIELEGDPRRKPSVGEEGSGRYERPADGRDSESDQRGQEEAHSSGERGRDGHVRDAQGGSAAA